MTDFSLQIAEKLAIEQARVHGALTLFAEGCSLPFVARYRKERTQNLDETQLRHIQETHAYLSDLTERKQAVLKSIDEQGKLTDELKQKINKVETKQAVEDLYEPYRRKRRSRGQQAVEKGLEPLAELMHQGEDVEGWLKDFLGDANEITRDEALSGGLDILAQAMADDAEVRSALRKACFKTGVIHAQVVDEFKQQKTKFEDYYEYSEPVSKVASHRYLAIRRGEAEKVLFLKITFEGLEPEPLILKNHLPKDHKANPWHHKAAVEAYKRLLKPSMELDLRLSLKMSADEESIAIFGENLKNLLLAPYGGSKRVLGLDPGFRTGTKWTMIDETGKLLEYGTIYPVPPRSDEKGARAQLTKAVKDHAPEFVCLGNGTASRELMAFLKGWKKDAGFDELHLLIVSESGASVYSASELAVKELPGLDVSFRGAVSIARRFQDPLAELVKIDPKAIGVGQYQHDVNQTRLKKSLEDQVISAVNYVGVDLNTASAPLLSFVSGLNGTLAKNIVEYREDHGAFILRKDLLKVKKLGPKTFEQAAGFLRILGGSNPLDATAVHPESYGLIETMAKDIGVGIQDLLAKTDSIDKLDTKAYLNDQIGILSMADILQELKKPGRDPRKSYVGPKLLDEVQTINDLIEAMVLEGTVTNLTKFGAFVDIGVHNDGLVHVSQIADRFIKDPSEVLKVGQIVKVKVLEVDKVKKRIALSMKLNMAAGPRATPKPKVKANQAPVPKPSKPADLRSLAEKFGRL